MSAVLSTLSSQQAATGGAAAAAPAAAAHGGSATSTPVKLQPASMAGAASPGAAKPVKLWVGYQAGADASALVLGASTPGSRGLRAPEGGRHGRAGGPEAARRALASLLEA
jgi:hypothetical protein